jgi:hypothetical protein
VEIDLTRAGYAVEGLSLQASGRLAVDERGRLDGRVTLRAENWRSLVERARAAGLLPALLTDVLENALALAAGRDGRAETLDIPLTLDEGQIRYGLIPLGTAPRLGRD